MMLIHVESEPGPAGVREPHSFMLGARCIAVREILDRWFAATHTYFKVSTNDGIYILRHDAASREWELTLYRAESG